MRLIDADELRQRFIKRIQPLIGKDNSNERHEYMSWLRSVHLLDDMPTVDIVRCKECKYCEDESYTDEDTGKEVKYLVCDRWYEQDDADGNMFPKADDFCSRGERAE